MLQVNEVSLTLGRDTLIFENLSVAIHAGQRCALVGRNGVGKTTLFELILGRLPTDAGDVTKPSAWRIAYMRQEAMSSDRSAIDFVLDGHEVLRNVERKIANLEAQAQDDALNESLNTQLAELYVQLDDLGGYQAEATAAEILDGLGFEASTFHDPHASFSGGWRIRLQLARTLMAPSELLLLDEPTNHLDLEAIVWLEAWLKRYQGTLVFISHDKRFIDQIADNVLHLETRAITTYRGNYTDFERERSLAATRQSTARVKQQKRIDEINDFARRFRAKATKAKQVQSRLRMLAKMTEIAPVLAETNYTFSFPNPDKLPQPLLHGRGLALGYPDHTVIRDLSFSVLPGDRIGVLGVNGAGKSTFLKSVVGDLAVLEGEFQSDIETGYFAQQQLDHLDLDRPIITTMLNAHEDMTPQQVKNYLGGWGFAGDDLGRDVATLSGGEKARLVLALLALEKPALLVLDEPTNHLDLSMRESLAVALQSYAGAVLLVSHDRELLDQCVDELWLVEDGKLQPFDGDLDDYIAHDARRRRQAKSRSGGSRKDARLASAASRADLKPLKKKIAKCESTFAKLSEDIDALDATLITPDANGASDAIQALMKSRARLVKQRDEMEAEWMQLLEKLEELEAAETP